MSTSGSLEEVLQSPTLDISSSSPSTPTPTLCFVVFVNSLYQPVLAQSHLGEKIAPVEGTNYKEKDIAHAFGGVAGRDISIAHCSECHCRNVNSDHVCFHFAWKHAVIGRSFPILQNKSAM